MGLVAVGSELTWSITSPDPDYKSGVVNISGPITKGKIARFLPLGPVREKVET